MSWREFNNDGDSTVEQRNLLGVEHLVWYFWCREAFLGKNIGKDKEGMNAADSFNVIMNAHSYQLHTADTLSGPKQREKSR